MKGLGQSASIDVLEGFIDPPPPSCEKNRLVLRGCCMIHQIVQLIDDIKGDFEIGPKAGVLLVELKAVYDKSCSICHTKEAQSRSHA